MIRGSVALKPDKKTMSHGDNKEAMYTLSDYLIDRLKEIGVEHLFGVPGDFVIPFLERVVNKSSDNKLDKTLKYVGTCNELNAAYAADGYARVKGVGALATTYVVGELSALNGVAGSFAERVPVVKITGYPSTTALKENWMLHHTFGDFQATIKMYKKVTAAHTMLSDAEKGPSEIDRVLRACLIKQLPVYIAFPSDMVIKPCKPPTRSLFGEDHLPGGLEETIVHLMEREYQKDQMSLKEAVSEAANMINHAKRPVVIAGVELHRYKMKNTFLKFLEKTKLPFATMMLGKSIIDEDHPQFIGLYEGKPSREYVRKRIEESDCVLLLGEWLTDLNTGGFSATLPYDYLIRANIDRVQIKHHFYRDISMKTFIEQLSQSLGPRNTVELDIHSAINGCTHRRTQRFEAKPEEKITINRFFDRVSSFIKENSIVLADVGTALYSASETLMPKGTTFIGQTFFGSIGYTIGSTLGAAIAASVDTKSSDRQVVLFIGDGAFQMTCQDISTIIHHGLKVVIFLINNEGYTIERLITDGAYNDIANWNYHQLPSVFGCKESFECKTEKDVEAALKKIESNKMKFAFVEIHTDKMDASENLKSAGVFMAGKAE